MLTSVCQHAHIYNVSRLTHIGKFDLMTSSKKREVITVGEQLGTWVSVPNLMAWSHAASLAKNTLQVGLRVELLCCWLFHSWSVWMSCTRHRITHIHSEGTNRTSQVRIKPSCVWSAAILWRTIHHPLTPVHKPLIKESDTMTHSIFACCFACWDWWVKQVRNEDHVWNIYFWKRDIKAAR